MSTWPVTALGGDADARSPLVTATKATQDGRTLGLRARPSASATSARSEPLQTGQVLSADARSGVADFYADHTLNVVCITPPPRGQPPS